MQIPWPSQTCILCLTESDLTVEHVIPASLGGKLTSRILCKGCNDRLGHGFESAARLAPELRRAANGIPAELDGLREALEVGARYHTQFGDHLGVQTVRRDGRLGTAKLPDQGQIVPEIDAPARLSSILQSRGASEAEVAAALFMWKEAEGGPIIDLGWNVIVRKWNDHPSTPAYTERAISPLVPLKIAYEFAALIIGTAILQPAPGFERIRAALIDQDEECARAIVVARRAPKPAAFHGMAFMGNRPEALIQVRLFGLLAYEVSLPAIGIDFGRFVYTHRLDTGEEWTHLPDEQGAHTVA